MSPTDHCFLQPSFKIYLCFINRVDILQDNVGPSAFAAYIVNLFGIHIKVINVTLLKFRKLHVLII